MKYTTEKEIIEKIKAHMESFVGSDVKVTFSIHEDTTTLVSVSVARQKDIVNLPDKRQREDGTKYTPICMLVTFKNFSFCFVVEDLIYKYLTDGIVLTIGDVAVTVRKA